VETENENGLIFRRPISIASFTDRQKIVKKLQLSFIFSANCKWRQLRSWNLQIVFTNSARRLPKTHKRNPVRFWQFV